MATVVQGADKLKRKLAIMPAAARAEIRKAMEKSAEEITELARSLVPVDSGELRASIGWNWGDAPSGSMVLGEVRTGSTAGNERILVYAGNDHAYYGRWVEFGTVKMRAQPFFFPAYRAVRKRVRGRVQRAIRNAAKKAAATGGSGVA